MSIITAASCNRSDVSTALSLASAGDVVVIPGGNCTWTTALFYTAPANFTLMGQTTCSGSGNPAFNNLTCNDVTVLTDALDRSSADNGMLNITTADSGTFRLTGITFSWGGGLATFNGSLAFHNNTPQFRVDHVHFNRINVIAFTHVDTINSGGVFDHILFDIPIGGSGGWRDYGDYNQQGDNNWAASTNLGGPNFMFFEDSIFNDASNDCVSGGRFIIRYNTFNSNGAQTHPTGGAGRGRGCRAWEIYGNKFQDAGTTNFNIFFMSSGTGVVWGNDAGNTYNHFVTIHSMRRDNSTYTQTATPNGWGFCGTSFNGTGSNWDQNSNTSTGYRCLDQPGQGQGDLLTGDFPNVTNNATGCISSQSCAWPRQALEPVYEWGDIWQTCSGCGGLFWNLFQPDAFSANADYYLCTNPGSGNCSGFTGATGVGMDIRANRPSTCTTGVAYWSTDQGSWNSSGSGGQGVLDKCTATNTWTNAWYVPYQYPHPLNTITAGTAAATPATPSTQLIILASIIIMLMWGMHILTRLW